MVANGNVASISVSVIPDLSKFVERANVGLKRAEKKLRKVKAEVVPVLDKLETKKVQNQLKEKFNETTAEVKVNLDALSAKVAKTELDAVARDRVSNVHVNVTKTSIGKARKQFQKGLQGETIWANIGAMWKPGTFEPLKRQFFKTFPDLKPWVWPQIDTEQLKKAGTEAREQLSKFGSNYMVYARAGWEKHPKGEADELWRKLAPHIKGLRAAVGIELKERDLTRDIARLAARVKNDAVTYWKFSADPKAKAKLLADIKAFGRVLKGKGATFKVHPEISLQDMATVKARLATIAKGTTHRVRLVLDGYQNLYKLYTRLGLRKAIRWKIQLEFKEAQRALGALKNISTEALKISSILSSIAMIATSILGIIGALEKAIVNMAPAFWPVLGSMASFAAGAGVAAVALRNAKTELEALQEPLRELNEGINQAFWAKAKVPLLENANKLIRESKQNIYALADAMGVFTAGVATGVGNSGESLRRIIDNSSKGFKILSESMRRIVETLLQLVGVGSDFFPVFAGWIDDLSYRFQAWADAIAKSEGGLEAWMQGGVDAAFLFGNVIRNMVGIVGDLAEAAAGAGGSLEGFNNKLVDMRERIADPGFQLGLGYLFTGIREGSQAVQDSIGDLINRIVVLGAPIGRLVTQIGELASAIIDTLGQAFVNSAVVTGITYLADGLEDVVRALGPVITGFTTGLAPVLAGLGDTLSANADGIALFAGNLGELALVSFENIGNLVGMILPVLLDVANALLPPLTEFARMLMPAILDTLEMVLPVLGQFVKEVGVGLVNALTKVLPSVMKLADAVLPALMTVLDALAPLIVTLADVLVSGLGAALEVVVPAVELLADAITWFVEGAIELFTGLWEFLTELWTGISEGASEAWTLISEIVSGFVEGAIELFTGLWEFITELWTGISEGASEAWTLITEIVTGFIEGFIEGFTTVVEFFSGVWTGFTEIVSGALTFISELWNTTWTAISEFFIGLWTSITEFFSGVWTTITTTVSTAVTNVQTWISDALTTIQSVWNTIWGAISTFVATIWVGIQTAVSTAISWVAKTIESILTGIKNVWDTIWGGISSFVVDVWEKIKGGVSSGITWVQDKITSILNAIQSTWEDIWGGIERFAKNTWDGITGFFESSVDGIRSTFRRIGDVIKAPIEGALNGIRSLWNSTVGKLSFTIPDWVPGLGGKGFSMPKLAEGAIITKPTIAMVGEAGDDEAVIPLPKIKPLLADALDSLGVNEGYGVIGGNTYQVSVAVDAKDLRDLRSITEFVDMLNVENRMRMGARA